MIKLDENLLVELGLAALPKDEKTSFLKHMYETLEMRVGTRLAERMNEQQMTEFEQFINSNDEQGAFHWLESNFPNYKEVVAEEFEKLKGEIKPVAADILAASQAQQVQQGQMNQSTPQPQPQMYSGQTDGQTGSQTAGQPIQQYSPQPAPQPSGYYPSQPYYPQQPAPPQNNPQVFQQPNPQIQQQYSTQSQTQQSGHHPQYPQHPQHPQYPQQPQTPPQLDQPDA